MFILLVGASLGNLYAGFVDRRLGPNDWRRWMALAPFWVLVPGVALVLHTVNTRGPAFEAILGFAGASFIEALIDSLRAHLRRRAGTSTRRDDRVIPFGDAST